MYRLGLPKYCDYCIVAIASIITVRSSDVLTIIIISSSSSIIIMIVRWCVDSVF